ncbi:hypothetical protein RR48_03587 [Papilio machaon]|uniref:Uncharacterized protein n=1 Tax=Papilio machaon TaxID=76193 RepID=A0A0N1ID48_PAPMA|nr:hypothetical protein RR48_03587 [Papilio machaon]
MQYSRRKDTIFVSKIYVALWAGFHVKSKPRSRPVPGGRLQRTPHQKKPQNLKNKTSHLNIWGWFPCMTADVGPRGAGGALGAGGAVGVRGAGVSGGEQGPDTNPGPPTLTASMVRSGERLKELPPSEIIYESPAKK